MRVHLTGAGLGERSSIPAFVDRFAHQRLPVRHTLVGEPAAADVVLFIDCHLLPPSDRHLRTLTETAVARRFPGKLAVYDERDQPWCRLPGIYVSQPSRAFRSAWQVAGGYHLMGSVEERVDAPARAVAPDLLFSFVGGRTHWCRDAIFRLRTPRSHIENTQGFVFYDTGSVRFEERRRRFVELLYRSKFVLCPRGAGISSFRMYETMAAARVPVIISDGWVPPEGPDWSGFSVRCRQRDVARIPALLAGMEPDAEAMGLRARAAFEEWFAPDVVVARQLDRLEALMASAGVARFPAHGSPASYASWLADRAEYDAWMLSARVRGALSRARRGSTPARGPAPRSMGEQDGSCRC